MNAKQTITLRLPGARALARRAFGAIPQCIARVPISSVALALLLLVLLPAGCGGNRSETGVRWSAQSSPDSVRVGDIFTLRWSGSWPASAEPAHLAWPLPGDSLIVLSRDSTAVRAPGERRARDYAIRALVARPGAVRIPEAALVSRTGDTLAVAKAFRLPVGGRLAATDTALRPLAPLVSLRGFPWWAAFLAGALALAAVLAWLLLRRRRVAGVTVPLPEIPPAIEFQRGIERLESLALAEKGEMRAFAQELSWILRRYLGRRWLRPALEATRPEIVRWLPETKLPVREQNDLAEWLARTDRVKFAGETPLLGEARDLAGRAASLVETTEEIFAREEERAREAEEQAREQAGQGRGAKTAGRARAPEKETHAAEAKGGER
ncbi:MAG: hypothetical protein KA123_01625 [Candidatus Eisenbacteria bacterium]|nr:hypothetical protein [Candidatus Eisenbacteria bacterium]